MTTTISVPDELADELYERKGRGESYADVIWRLLEAAESAETGGTETAEDEPPPSDPAPETAAQEPEPAEEPVEDVPPADLDTLVEQVGEEVLPGSGAKQQRRIKALQAVVDYLREHGEATPSEFGEAIYPDHPADYSSERSWWKNAMYKGLRAIADRTDAIERADTTGEWSYRGETDA